MSERVVVQPDGAAIGAFVQAVFGKTGGYVAARLLREKGAADDVPHSVYLPVNDTLTADLVTQAHLAARDQRGFYVVPGTVAAPQRARAEDITQMAVIVVDIDSGDIAAKVAHLIENLGSPTFEVASSGITEEGQGKRHLYWCLTERVEGEQVRALCALRGTIARKGGGDPAFRSPHQPIRVPGSVHGKNGVRTVRGSSQCPVVNSISTNWLRRWNACPGSEGRWSSRGRTHCRPHRT